MSALLVLALHPHFLRLHGSVLCSGWCFLPSLASGSTTASSGVENFIKQFGSTAYHIRMDMHRILSNPLSPCSYRGSLRRFGPLFTPSPVSAPSTCASLIAQRLHTTMVVLVDTLLSRPKPHQRQRFSSHHDLNIRFRPEQFPPGFRRCRFILVCPKWTT